MNSIFAQEPPCYPPAVFQGPPEAGFCDETPLPPCTSTLGKGIPNSSMLFPNELSGTICVEGSFSISANTSFSFKNATLLISPGKEIVVQTGATLILDNASLHGCDGLWKGIRLEEGASIHTMNNTLIEDAEKAINARFVSAVLEIENTTFNRNLTGIWLEDNLFAPNPPFISKLSDTYFKCTAPIVGTTADIAEHGIYAKNNPLFFAFSSTNNAQQVHFSNLKYGIKVEGQSATLQGSNFIFRDILFACVEMEKGKVALSGSYFLNFGVYGIFIEGTQGLRLDGCEFYVAETFPKYNPQNGGHRYAVLPLGDSNFPVQVEINIQNSHFQYICPNTSVAETFHGVYLVNSGFQSISALIIDNQFTMRGKHAATGITLNGPFSANPADVFDIMSNEFITTASLVPLLQNQVGMFGIQARGRLNNVHVFDNTFNGDIRSDSASLSNDVGVEFSALQGDGNYITDNSFYGQTSAGAQILESTNVRFCSNYGFTDRTAYYLGNNFGADMSQNQYAFNGFDIQGVIGWQLQKDNTFINYLLFGLIKEGYARCLLNNCNAFSRFEVRQTYNPAFGIPVYYPLQQICGTGIMPCSPGDEFFVNINGTPSATCLTQLDNPTDESFLLLIANDEIPDVDEYPAKRWFYEDFLYRKLKNDSLLLASNSLYSTFVQNKSATPLGQFFEVEKMVKTGKSSATAFDNAISTGLAGLKAIEVQLANTDSLLALGTTIGLVTIKKNLISSWMSAQAQLEPELIGKKTWLNSQVQAALNLNNNISTSTAVEANQKSLNQILLSAQLAQNGQLNATQVSSLSALAVQNYRNEGNSVFLAAAALSGCDAFQPDFWQNAGQEWVLPLPRPEIEGFRGELFHVHKPGAQGMTAFYSNGALMVKCPEDFAGDIYVFDVTGRVLGQWPMDNSGYFLPLPIPELPTGILFIFAKGGNKAYSTKVPVIR